MVCILVQAIGAAEKIFELIDRPPLFNHSPPGGEAPESFEAKIELQAVTLRYPLRPEHPALWRMSLTCENGEMCALVGPSGGGKSSVVRRREKKRELKKKKGAPYKQKNGDNVEP